jgi:sporulation protein YlmC with PRC-barrel domain
MPARRGPVLDASMPLRRLVLRSPVDCADARFGELADVVIDPTTRCVTHLVVRPHKHPEDARMVPVAWASADGPEAAITLSATLAEVDRLDRVHETEYLRLGAFPVDDPDWDVGVEDLLGLPYYQGLEAQPVEADPHVMVGYDRLPKGEVEIRRGSGVTSADGAEVGSVDGFVVDSAGHISHVLLERGHLWGRREVAIPLTAVARVENDVVVLGLGKDEVGALPSHRVHRWGRR